MPTDNLITFYHNIFEIRTDQSVINAEGIIIKKQEINSTLFKIKSEYYKVGLNTKRMPVFLFLSRGKGGKPSPLGEHFSIKSLLHPIKFWI